MVMFTPGAIDADPRLGHALRRVRVRYALRVLVRGLAILAVGLLVGVSVSAWGLDAFRYARGAVVWIRTLLYLWLAFLAIRFVVVPLWRGHRQASDAAIARYIEEHEPSLDAALRSAVDVTVARADSTDQRSSALHNRLVDDVVQRLEAFDLPREVERREIRQAGILLATAAALGVVFLLLAPGFIRQAFPYLFDPFSNSGRSATPYRITVTPGNHTLPRGSDQEVQAQLTGFDGAAELVSRSGGGAWARSPMVRDEGGDKAAYRFIMLSVLEPTEYFVESSGTRSEVFRLDVVDRPYVKKIDLEYRFPAYARLDPEPVEGTGDITALAGTRVAFSITPTVPVKAARLVVQGEESKPIPLEVAAGGGALTGLMSLTHDGFYKVEMQGADGQFVAASPDYVIEVVPDLPPRIAFDRPGRDTQATPIEEVFTQVKAEDDFGVAKLELVYSRNGAAETVVPLHTSPVLKDVVASHTFFLEEMSMKPGDFISYYARATDVGAPGRQATSDIYFLEARPYRRDFRQAEQGGGGGGGGQDPGSLSQQERQIIAATFRLIRDAASNERDARTIAQDAQTVALIQGRLRAQVEGLVTRMLARGALPDGSPMHGTADELRQAMEKMTLAETELKAPRPKTALPIEQAVLAHLQRAEASFRDVQVSMGGGGGGGGGSSNSSAEELADLYELDLDKLRNQYETLQSGAQEQRDQKVDEALSKLQELARRQEQENERARQRGARTPNQGGGGGGSQKQLADEAEELGRQLERLTRENGSPALEESARRLREAAAAMRQQANAPRGQSQGGGQAGESPIDRLREARRLLDSERSTRLDRDLSGFAEKAEALKRAQGQIATEMRELSQGQGAGTPGQPGSSKAERLKERKDSLAAEVAELESRLDKVSREARREQKETSRKLQEAANGIRDSKLKEKIRYTKALVDRPGAGNAEAFEADIAESIDALGDQIRDAGRSVGSSPEKKRQAALDRARELARSLDSMEERLRARAGAPSQEGDGKAEGDGKSPGKQGQNPSNAGGSEGQQGKGEGQAEGQGQGQGQGAPGDRAGAGMAGSGQDQSGSANGGRPGGAGGLGGVGAGRMGSAEGRQLRREIAERVQDAEALRRALEESGVSSPQAAAMAGRLQALATDRNFRDPLGLAELTAQVSDDIKMLEYILRREADGARPALQLSGSEELPPGYKSMVEEYYRTLGKKSKK
jgi:hypothetical protein